MGETLGDTQQWERLPGRHSAVEDAPMETLSSGRGSRGDNKQWERLPGKHSPVGEVPGRDSRGDTQQRNPSLEKYDAMVHFSFVRACASCVSCVCISIMHATTRQLKSNDSTFLLNNPQFLDIQCGMWILGSR